MFENKINDECDNIIFLLYPNKSYLHVSIVKADNAYLGIILIFIAIFVY